MADTVESALANHLKNKFLLGNGPLVRFRDLDNILSDLSTTRFTRHTAHKLLHSGCVLKPDFLTAASNKSSVVTQPLMSS